METVISIISDVIIIFFNCGLYMSLTPLKKDNKLYKGLMIGLCIIPVIAYFVVTYVFKWPYGLSSAVCMSIPTFILFFSLSKYKNSRFLVTFCFVDTITFIIASFAKLGLIVGGIVGAIIGCVALFIICTIVFIRVFPYRMKYRELMDSVEKGWGPMAISAVCIYILLIAFTAYPKPLIERPEYYVIYIILCLSVLTFYGVYLLLVKEKSQLLKANIQLQQQQHWHKLAYLDTLTQLSNKAAYDCRVLEITSEGNHELDRYIMMIDIDKFKSVNDTYGHLVGNDVLKKTAKFFKKTFDPKKYEVFRVGGDEFAVIATDVNLDEVKEMAKIINSEKSDDGYECTFSCGYAKLNYEAEDPFEQCFFEADKAMYKEKANKKIN